jgi:hypothetical protein
MIRLALSEQRRAALERALSVVDKLELAAGLAAIIETPEFPRSVRLDAAALMHGIARSHILNSSGLKRAAGWSRS